MKLLSALFAAALLSVSILPSSAQARRHHPSSSSSSSSSPLERAESRLDSLVQKIEQLELRLQENRVEKDLNQLEQQEEGEFNENENEDEEGDEQQVEEEDVAAMDSASFVDPTLSTWSRFTHTWGSPASTPEKNAWFTVPHLDVSSLGSGWSQDTSKPCSSGSAVGNRYRPISSNPNADALWMLYGSNGELAGLQSVVTINPGPAALAPRGPYTQEVGVNGEPVWTITAYFRNPKDGSICNANTPKTGRVGDGLWFPYTGDASKAESVPLSVQKKQSTINVSLAGQREYTVGNCMDTMGVHWWRSRWSDKCDGSALDPYFLLYHPKTNNLLGFGFLQLLGVATEYQAENYWEHVPVVAAPIFQKPSQISLDLVKGVVDGRKFKLQSQHYYFIDNPRKEISCIPFFPSTIPPSNAGEVQKTVEKFALTQTRSLPRSAGGAAGHHGKKVKKATAPKRKAAPHKKQH